MYNTKTYTVRQTVYSLHEMKNLSIQTLELSHYVLHI